MIDTVRVPMDEVDDAALVQELAKRGLIFGGHQSSFTLPMRNCKRRDKRFGGGRPHRLSLPSAVFLGMQEALSVKRRWSDSARTRRVALPLGAGSARPRRRRIRH